MATKIITKVEMEHQLGDSTRIMAAAIMDHVNKELKEAKLDKVTLDELMTKISYGDCQVWIEDNIINYRLSILR